MFNRLQRLYSEGKITPEGLQNAVAKNWISQEEYEAIISSEVTE